MKKLFLYLVLIMAVSINVFAIEEVQIEESDFEVFASIASTVLYTVMIASSPVAIGSAFALMRYDKEVKVFLQNEISKIDHEINEMIENEAVNIKINYEADVIQQKIYHLEEKLRRI